MTDLTGSLQAVGDIAGAAGLARAEAVGEAAALAAAVAEHTPGAHTDWLAATGGGSTADFFDAASRGRRWRSGPTPCLSELVATGSVDAPRFARALVDVTVAAALLGHPTPLVTGVATMAGAAQLAALPAPAEPTSGIGVAHRGDGGHLASPGTAGHPAAQEARPAPAVEVPASTPAPTRTVHELLGELDGLIGLDRVKREVHEQTALVAMSTKRAARGLKTPKVSRHLVFVGNPGTGKTTVARLVAGIYAALGVLSKGHLVEVERKDLVAGYVGQSELKTAEVLQRASGGVLFIDEAYSLADDQYGEVVIATLLTAMENDRADLVVIAAGYPGPMGEFMDSNPGMRSRMRTTIIFEDYSDDELVAIFTKLADSGDYTPTEEAVDALRTLLRTTVRDETFGNGRFVRNVLEAAIGRQSWRLRDVEDPTVEQMRELLPQDVLPPDTDPLNLDEIPIPEPAEPSDGATSGTDPHQDAPVPVPDDPAQRAAEGETA